MIYSCIFIFSNVIFSRIRKYIFSHMMIILLAHIYKNQINLEYTLQIPNRTTVLKIYIYIFLKSLNPHCSLFSFYFKHCYRSNIISNSLLIPQTLTRLWDANVIRFINAARCIYETYY